ncbi:aminodeoxychorismate synthase component I [Fodinibius saliphilus]|uniref:aminodeoxychorismate synthase component I n=1 Tax=Fodinibius saliphilus TaxID=1920650 RepID=UPI001108DBED|nr:aminodeoxychorismate synthase component I [Fodinibius saliphilus]
MMASLHELTQYLSEQGPLLLLESQSPKHPWGRSSYIAGKPKAIIKARDRNISVEGEGKSIFNENPWKALQEFRENHSDWLFGYLGYDLKNHTEELYSANNDPVRAPDLFFMVPEVLVKYHHATGHFEMIKGELPSDMQLRSDNNKPGSLFNFINLRPQLNSADYILKIKEAQHRIAEGDFYEINLSHQLKADFKGSAFALYQQMKRVGPVPFGSYLDFEDIKVCCQSPERFIRKERNTVFSQPIKGTSQRGENDQEDEQLKRALIESPKEQAENLMIVDLVRNDLSKIARHGTVEVPKLFEIESFDTVHQMVSTVTAEVAVDDPVAILKACFPMGSMTGAPKISAMEAIEELEEYRRGIYSGAVGYIRPNGDFDFNVVIRTAIIKDDKLYYAAGGAITADSNPQREWEETLIKTRALQRTIAEEPIKG